MRSTIVAVDTPADVAQAYGVVPCAASEVPRAMAYEAWLAKQVAHEGAASLSPRTFLNCETDW